jgi:hypothetical protein
VVSPKQEKKNSSMKLNSRKQALPVMLSWPGTLVTSSFTLKCLHNTVVKFIMFNHQIVKKPAKQK